MCFQQLKQLYFLAAATDNFVASPISAIVLLSALLTAQGPKGDTAREVCRSLVGPNHAASCDDPEYPVVEANLTNIRAGVDRAVGEDSKRVFTLANGAFLQRGFHPSPGFLHRFAMVPGDIVELVSP